MCQIRVPNSMQKFDMIAHGHAKKSVQFVQPRAAAASDERAKAQADRFHRRESNVSERFVCWWDATGSSLVHSRG